MTRKVGKNVHVYAEPSSSCELCGKVAELRPYGPNGEQVCFPCGMKDEEAAKLAFQKVIDAPAEKLH